MKFVPQSAVPSFSPFSHLLPFVAVVAVGAASLLPAAAQNRATSHTTANASVKSKAPAVTKSKAPALSSRTGLRKAPLAQTARAGQKRLAAPAAQPAARRATPVARPVRLAPPAAQPNRAPIISTVPRAGVPVLDPNRTAYPRASMHDFSNLLDAPAGKYGFLQSKGEHFVWPNGKRARFWGINVANTSLMESDHDITQIINNFKTAGFNLVRLHHFDERGGIIDLQAKDSRRFLPDRLRKLDFWIHKARQAGLYVYLDLLDYRRFKEGDGVPNAEAIGRAGRPYNVFDPRLIELQKEYAYKLLREHVNPYTGLAYVDDPAIVMLEIYDESGLFMRRDVWRTMPEPYARRFKTMWNAWLRARYKTTQGLASAWTDAYGVSTLTSGESLERGTVELPAMTWTPQLLPASQRVWATQVRRNDGALFAHDVHKKYFREMKAYMHSIGVKIPISVTGRFEDLADLRGISEELDFIGSNFYYDHPYWAKKAPAWQVPSYFHNHNPVSDIDDRSMAAGISLARVRGKPFVVREWNYCWPNRSRSTGMIEAAAYASLHDIDAMILFVYETRPTARVSYFNVRSDPSRWGLVGVGAQIFLQGLIQPSRHRIVVPYNTVDVFTYQRYHQPFYALGWATRVENDFFDGPIYRPDKSMPADLIVPPGRSGIGRYEGAPAVLHTENLRRDLAGRSVSAPQYLTEYGIVGQPAGNVTLSFDGIMFGPGVQRDRNLSMALPLAPLAGAGLRVIGHNQLQNVANGFLDEKKKRFVFGSLEPMDVLRASLDALQMFHGVPNNHDATEQNVFGTDTGEMWRDAASGRLVVSTPQFQALCGNLNGVGRVLVPGLRVRNLKSGTLIALALDNKPLVDSRHFVIKLVTDARNLDEDSQRDPRFAHLPQGQWKIGVLGQGPVTTFGRASKTPIQIGIEGRPLADIYLDRGSFELVVNGNNWQFYCDTPGARFALYRNGQSRGNQATAGANAGARTGLQSVGLAGDVRMLPQPAGAPRPLSQFPADVALVRGMG
ncbi:MAG: hypothetical protein JWN98_2166 [Abditibacteriota bacterium]|nr:hypothetical protein [Abditibacteriota bacterium]